MPSIPVIFLHDGRDQDTRRVLTLEFTKFVKPDYFVMVVRRDTVARLKVRVIDWPSERIVVLEGVMPGDMVAMSPRTLRAGLAVRTKASPRAL